MKIFSWNDILTLLNNGKEEPFFDKGCGISIGSFDGLHKGHRLLIKTLVTECKKENLLSGVVTFKRPLPGLKHHNDYAGDISTLSQRLSLLSDFNVDFVIVVDFDDSFASMLGTDFFNLLINVCNMKLLAEGVDFRCGYKGATDFSAIKYFGKEHNIKTFFVEPVFFENSVGENERVSSSIIRNMIKKGFLTAAFELLERPYDLLLPSDSLKIKKSLLTQVIPPKNIYHCKNKNGDDIRVEITDDEIVLDKKSNELIF